MTQAQRDFAYKCIEWGETNYGLGHTLAGIAWMESSLGADTTHDEDSYGYFGLSTRTKCSIYQDSKKYRALSAKAKRINSLPGFNNQGGRISARETAILIYTDNIRYIRQHYKNRGLTITDREAWRKAAQVYPGGTNWQKRGKYGDTFRKRVGFLRGLK